MPDSGDGRAAPGVLGPRPLRRLMDCARVHGEAEDPGHEVGDLQEFLRAAYELLDDEGRRHFWEAGRVREIVRTIPEYARLRDDAHEQGDEYARSG